MRLSRLPSEMRCATETAAASGRDALEIIGNARRIDLLLTDIGLPHGMNGTELARRARSLLPGLRVLFISGYTHGALDAQDIAAEGFDLALAGRLVEPALAARLELEVLHRVGYVHARAIDAGFGERPVEELSRRADERTPCEIFLVAGLLPHEHHRSAPGKVPLSW